MRDPSAMRRQLTAAVVGVLGVAMVASCGGDGDPGIGAGDQGPPTSTPMDFESGADGATAATIAPDIDHGSPEAVLSQDAASQPLLQQIDEAMTLHYLQRRFGELVDLSWADPLIDRANQHLAAAPEDEPLRFTARFLDAGAELPESVEGMELGDPDRAVDTDVIVAATLWCDRIELPDDFLGTLRSSAEFGGYDLTHALGGAQLMVENGCLNVEESAPLLDDLATATAPLLEDEPPADLALEACAILAWVGRWDLIPEDFAARVADAQLPDGGWPLEVGQTESDRHATVWGLRCALELEFGASAEPTPWVPT